MLKFEKKREGQAFIIKIKVFEPQAALDLPTLL